MRKQSIGNQASLLPLLMILPWRLGEKKEKHWYFKWWSFQHLPWNLLPRVIELLDCKLTPAQGFEKFSRGRERLCLNHHPLHTKKKKPKKTSSISFQAGGDTLNSQGATGRGEKKREFFVSGRVECFVPISIFITLIKRWSTFPD